MSKNPTIHFPYYDSTFYILKPKLELDAWELVGKKIYTKLIVLNKYIQKQYFKIYVYIVGPIKPNGF